MAVDGFFERYTDIKIIASQDGGYIPFVDGRPADEATAVRAFGL